ncbi:MAG: DUF1566 domain-containing protein, partial [Myxococcota bacterium]|nr:DUF1566 domain-containing protein [Myxococcota bacterium]
MWNEAHTYCKNKSSLEPGKMWRLPTKPELLALSNREGNLRSVFPGIKFQDIWSATRSRRKVNYYWLVDPSRKTSRITSGSNSASFRCVLSHHEKEEKAAKSPSRQVFVPRMNKRSQKQPAARQLISHLDRYRSVGNGLNGIVQDQWQGLTWHQEAYRFVEWQKALHFCRKSRAAGLRDWRLPNINELLSLFSSRQNNGINSFFPQISGKETYWSATSPVTNSNQVWSVNFKGTPGSKDKQRLLVSKSGAGTRLPRLALCVRGKMQK